MAGGSRTLKLSILADVDNLNKGLKSAETDVDSFGGKIGAAGAKIGKAFAAAAAAAGAAAIAIGIESVKAAVADEKAQTQLALALENATGATTAQIAATEKTILKMSLATGITDDELRPALGRLVRSTGDTTEAQKLLALAMDVSTATGKPLEAVSNSLARGFDGNTTALGKLGVGLSAAELKSMSFEEVQGRLSDLFGGAAAANAETYAGKIARVQVAFGEAKETLGTALLPILGTLLDFINQKALPAITAFTDAFSITKGEGFGKVISDVGTTITKTFTPIVEGMKKVFESVKTAILNSKDEFKAFWDVIKYVAPLIGSAIGGSLAVIGDVAEVVITVIAKVLGFIKPLLNTAIDGINLLIKGLNLIRSGADIALIPKIGAASTSTGALGNFSMSTGQTPTSTGKTSNATGGTGGIDVTGAAIGGGAGTTKTASGVAKVSEAAIKAASDAAAIAWGATFKMGNFPSSAPTINLTVNGAIDKEGTARTIVETLNNSFYRGTGGANNLVTL